MDKFPAGYKPIELLATLWNDDMAARFPNADHSDCRVEVDLRTLTLIGCRGWHCNRCGEAINPITLHSCPDRPS